MALFYGPLAGSGALSDYDFQVYNTWGSGAGYAVAHAGDHDADGYGDMLVGAPGYPDGARVWGAAFLVTGDPYP